MNFPFIWYNNVGGTFVRFLTIHACDGQRDRQTDGRHYDHEDHGCIQCSAVKISHYGDSLQMMMMIIVYDISEPDDVKTTPTATATSRSPAIKGILKTTQTTTSEPASTPTTTKKNDVTMTSRNDTSTGSPDPKRRGILRKQLSFETDDPTAIQRQSAPQPPPPPPPLSSEPQRPRPQRSDSANVSAVVPTTSPADAEDREGEGSSAAARTPRIKNKAVARRLMLRDRRSVDDETMTSFPEEDRPSGDDR